MLKISVREVRPNNRVRDQHLSCYSGEHDKTILSDFEMYDLNGADIFAVGKHKGKVYTSKDLDHILEAFNKLGRRVHAPLKVGHDNKLAHTDGRPAVGWVENVRRVGNKLVADFKRMPKVVYEAVRRGLYNEVSSEIWSQFEDSDGNVWPRVLTGVAILGANIPAVDNISDLASLFSREEIEMTGKGRSDHIFEGGGAVLKKLRTGKGMSIGQLAGLSGVNADALEATEAGQGAITVSELERIVEALGTSIDEVRSQAENLSREDGEEGSDEANGGEGEEGEEGEGSDDSDSDESGDTDANEEGEEEGDDTEGGDAEGEGSDEDADDKGSQEGQMSEETLTKLAKLHGVEEEGLTAENLLERIEAKTAAEEGEKSDLAKEVEALSKKVDEQNEVIVSQQSDIDVKKAEAVKADVFSKLVKTGKVSQAHGDQIANLLVSQQMPEHFSKGSDKAPEDVLGMLAEAIPDNATTPKEGAALLEFNREADEKEKIDYKKLGREIATGEVSA